jgi:hypothetical protein
MKNKILTALYQSKELADLLNKMNPEHLREDLKQELFLALTETPESKIIALHEKGQLRFYACRIVLNMIASNTSPFHKKFRQCVLSFMDDLPHPEEREEESRSFGLNQAFATDFNEVEEKEYQHNALLTAVNKCLDEMPYYEQNLFKAYVEAGSAGKMIKAMKQQTGHYIPKRSILVTVKKVKDQIRKEVKL